MLFVSISKPFAFYHPNHEILQLYFDTEITSDFHFLDKSSPKTNFSVFNQGSSTKMNKAEDIKME